MEQRSKVTQHTVSHVAHFQIDTTTLEDKAEHGSVLLSRNSSEWTFSLFPTFLSLEAELSLFLFRSLL